MSNPYLKERVVAYSPWSELTEQEKLQIFADVEQVLTKRDILWSRYSRGIDIATTGMVHYEPSVADNDDTHLSVLLEKFIVDIAAGYLSGAVEYDVDVADDITGKIGKKVFGKEPLTAEEATELRYILDTLGVKNHDAVELTALFRDALLYGCCYERVLEDKKKGYQYYRLDGLNTVAVWTDDVNPEVMAVVSVFKKVVKNSITRYYYRVYLKDSIEVYHRDDKMATQVKVKNKKKSDATPDEGLKLDEQVGHYWDRVPVLVYESQFSILDKCASQISAYETLLNNVRNTYKYNAEDCKMKISGYRPVNNITIPNPNYNSSKEESSSNPSVIVNQARLIEDNAMLSGKTFYVQEGGDVDWIVKPVDADDATTMLKYYVDSIFQLSGIPNTTDLAFNSADLNASAIDRKFYIMNIITSELREGMIQLIYERFGMLLDRINLKIGSHYDVENVRINIGTNLPSMTDETIDQMMRLDGIVSQETILEKLGYDYETEQYRKEREGFGLLGENNGENTEGTNQNNQEQSGGADSSSSDDNQTNQDIQSNSENAISSTNGGTNSTSIQSSKSISSPIGQTTRGGNQN